MRKLSGGVSRQAACSEELPGGGSAHVQGHLTGLGCLGHDEFRSWPFRVFLLHESLVRGLGLNVVGHVALGRTTYGFCAMLAVCACTAGANPTREIIPQLTNAIAGGGVDDIYHVANFTQGNLIPSAPIPPGPGLLRLHGPCHNQRVPIQPVNVLESHSLHLVFPARSAEMIVQPLERLRLDKIV
jgi:hypothetical protein